jgi:glycerophosphoryl diester phosphodiesterase
MTLIYAHRGSSGHCPENTLLAFRRALAAGCDGIELDVHSTADGVPVVIHDRDVARTTTGRGMVDAMTLSEVQALDAGMGQRVSTLAEVLELVAGEVHLDIEIKGRGIEREVLAVLARYPWPRFAISSFNWDTLRELRRLDRTVELWPLAEQVDDALVAVAAELGSPNVAVAAAAFHAESAARLAGAELGTMVWTVNDPVAAHRVRGLGAHALCTDVPERIIAALAQTG